MKFSELKIPWLSFNSILLRSFIFITTLAVLNASYVFICLKLGRSLDRSVLIKAKKPHLCQTIADFYACLYGVKAQY